MVVFGLPVVVVFGLPVVVVVVLTGHGQGVVVVLGSGVVVVVFGSGVVLVVVGVFVHVFDVVLHELEAASQTCLH